MVTARTLAPAHVPTLVWLAEMHLAQSRPELAEPLLNQARTLDQLAESFDMVGLDDAARAAFPGLDLDEDQARDVRFGRALPAVALPADGPVAMFAPDGSFLALYETAGAGARPVAVFV